VRLIRLVTSSGALYRGQLPYMTWQGRSGSAPAAGSPVAFMSCLFAHTQRLANVCPGRATRAS